MTGGLDSSSVAVIAADMLAQNGQKLNTFTAVPEPGFKREEKLGRYFDETPYVRRIAEAKPNIVPHFIPPTKGPVVEQIAEQIRVAGAPVGGVVNGLWTIDILAAARSAGHSVMLSGEMGDHTMSYSGYPLLGELLRKGRWWRLFLEIRSSGFRWKRMIRQHTIAANVPEPIFRWYKYWRRGGLPPWHDSSAIHPKFAAQSGVVDRAAREYLPFDQPPAREGRLHRIRAFNSYSETADWFARLRASFGIDVRTPAFDRRIVEFCIGIPHDQFLRRGNDRWLMRRAMKGQLPEVILEKKKWGAQAPDWFRRLSRERDHIRAEVNRLAENSEVASIIDLEKLTTILDYWPDREPEYHSQESYAAFLTIPQALGAAAFIENVTGTNYGRI
jgi:asparagine synthase (glutamine-hydrolysing)